MSDYFTVMTGGYRPQDLITNVRQGGGYFFVVAVPWGLVLPHEKQAKANHGQTLKGLDGRGGLSACELLAVLEDRPWRELTDFEAHSKVAALLYAYLAALTKASSP